MEKGKFSVLNDCFRMCGVKFKKKKKANGQDGSSSVHVVQCLALGQCHVLFSVKVVPGGARELYEFHESSEFQGTEACQMIF